MSHRGRTAVTATGVIWTRYATQIIPVRNTLGPERIPCPHQPLLTMRLFVSSSGELQSDVCQRRHGA